MAATWLLVVGLLACRPLSEEVKDPAAGLNGGFEVARDGLPVNWIVYTPRTVPHARFEVLLDEAEHVEGEQSLRFRVEDCSGEGGWRSPGLCQEFPVEPGSLQRLSFRVKNEGCLWNASIRGVSAKRGDPERVRADGVPQGSWQLVTLEYRMPGEYDRLRFELGITSPGDLHVDDLRLETVGEPAASR